MLKRFLALIICSIGIALTLQATEPLIRSLDIRGLQVNGTTTLIIDGDSLGKNPKLLLPFPATQVLNLKSTDKQASFNLTLGKDVIPGFYQISLLTDGGVSLPFLIGVDHLHQKPFAKTIEQLPIAMHGIISGSQILESQFEGVKGQQLFIEVEAQKFGSKFQPVLHLYNSKKLQLAWSWPTPRLSGDTRLEAILPEDGTYIITMHDLEYAAGNPGYFRIKVGQWEFVDQVIPSGVVNGQIKSVELMGSTNGIKIDMPTSRVNNTLALPWPLTGKWSGMRPFLPSSTYTEFVEQPSPPLQEVKTFPLGINGKLTSPFEEDRYKLTCSPKSKLRFDLFAERLGSPLDAGLVLRNDTGVEIARSEDRPGSSDPLLEFVVPEKTTSLLVCIVDSLGRGNLKAHYRLVIDDISVTEPGIHFELATPIQRLSLAINDKVVVPVWLNRKGYKGKVDVGFSKLPSGVKVEGGLIPPDAEGTLLTISSSGMNNGAALTTLFGKDEKNIEADVQVLNHPLQKLQPWLASEIAIAPIIEKAVPFSVEWKDIGKGIALVQGMQLNLPVKVNRPDPNTVIRLTLLTSQNAPKLNNQPDPKVAIRAEKAVEVAAKLTEINFGVLVPVAPIGSIYDLSIQADLLSANKQVVLATAYAPVLRLPIKNPLLFSLDKGTKLEAIFDAKKGAEFLFKGKVQRLEGLIGDITLVATGLPAGARFEPALLKADKNDFDGKIIFPVTLMPQEYKDVKLVASGIPDPKQAAVKVNSKELDLSLLLKPASKP